MQKFKNEQIKRINKKIIKQIKKKRDADTFIRYIGICTEWTCPWFKQKPINSMDLQLFD